MLYSRLGKALIPRMQMRELCRGGRREASTRRRLYRVFCQCTYLSLIYIMAMTTTTFSPYRTRCGTSGCLNSSTLIWTTLTVPKPDQTIGWSAKIFPYPRALASLGPYAYPLVQTSKLLFPAFTVEGKGDLGIFASTYYRACYMRHRLSRNAMSNIDSLSLNSSLNC